MSLNAVRVVERDLGHLIFNVWGALGLTHEILVDVAERFYFFQEELVFIWGEAFVGVGDSNLDEISELGAAVQSGSATNLPVKMLNDLLAERKTKSNSRVLEVRSWTLDLAEQLE